MLVDTHAHIHFADYDSLERYSSDRALLAGAPDLETVLANAKEAGVEKIICVGVDAEDSAKAIKLAGQHDQLFATIGLHPHEAKSGQPALNKLKDLVKQPKVVGVGECGLDFFRNLSPREDQVRSLRFQIELGLEHKLPMVFHVRDAWEDFFKIVDDYPGVRGVVHCFTSTKSNLDKAVERGFYVAFNGIMTFTKDQFQLEAAKTCPLDKMVLETDCPFLSPAPKRGQVNQPANLKLTAEFLAGLRGEDFEQLADQTSQNARQLFDL